MKKITKIIDSVAILGILLSILITACGTGAPAAPTIDPGAVYTMAAATVQAQLTQVAAQNPTAIPATATQPAPTQKPTVAPTIEIAVQPTSPFGQTTTLPTLASGLNPGMNPTSAQPAGFKFGDVAEFQYNIPADGTVFAPGLPFQMEVGFKNVGSVVWTTDYSLRYVGGQQMSGVTEIPLKVAVKPGEKAIFITDLHAPGEPNSTTKPQYLSYWHMTTQTGLAVANGDMYIKIIVKREY